MTQTKQIKSDTKLEKKKNVKSVSNDDETPSPGHICFKFFSSSSNEIESVSNDDTQSPGHIHTYGQTKS